MKLNGLVLTIMLAGEGLASGGTSATAEAGIVCAADMPANVLLAAREIRRYVYLRTGVLMAVAQAPGGANATIVLEIGKSLETQQYRLKTEGTTLTLSGGSDIAVLYGAYALAEKLGVRFYLHGDVVPDVGIPFALPQLDETHKPLFALRGVNPWGCHPYGMDAWSADDYKAVFTQLAKMRMNFLGIHCYPEGPPYAAEPTVWHGLAGDFDASGQVQSSYPSHYFSALASGFGQAFHGKETGKFRFGGASLFERDDWAPPVMVGQCPVPTTPAGSNEVFNRMAGQFHDAFSFARQLGVRTCLGTEAPLTIPAAVREHLQAQGKNPADPAAVREVYAATFRRIMASHPLDYYWLWTPESWTWEGDKPQQYQATIADIKLAHEALTNVGAPFKLATSGWVLGPAHDRAAFDHDLPKDIPMSAISRAVGHTEVDPAFGRIDGREKWAIPWLESDAHQGLAGIQLYAGRMRRDAADAAAYGCTGLMGLHWRTEILAPNVSALALAAWDQSWKPSATREPEQDWSMDAKSAIYPDSRITGTSDEALYRSCCYDMSGGKMKVPNGRYKVTLKFCEPHFKAPGERVFDVKLQGNTVIENLDIFAKVGQFAALDFSFDDVSVTDGNLRIGFIARKSLPCISAIAVDGPGFVRKINCGGPAYQDYLAGGPQAPRERYLPCDDFYNDWAAASFGPEAAAGIARVFTGIDGNVPLATSDGCPVGPLDPDATPWTTVAARFAFVDALEKLRPMVRGAGNLERFNYWLNTFLYYRSLAQVRCALGAKAAPQEITRLWGDTCGYLLESVNTPGALAAVVSMENHPGWGDLVARQAALPWPQDYQGTPRLIVPTVRSIAGKDEALTLTVMALDKQPVQNVVLRWRPLGHGRWQQQEMTHVTRAIYRATLPASAESMEYYLQAVTASGGQLVWPATAPDLNQTVVALP